MNALVWRPRKNEALADCGTDIYQKVSSIGIYQVVSSTCKCQDVPSTGQEPRQRKMENDQKNVDREAVDIIDVQHHIISLSLFLSPPQVLK